MMPFDMLNKDFIKLLFVKQKKLLKKADTKMIKPPHFDELSVEKLYPYVVAQEGMADYFPESCK